MSANMILDGRIDREETNARCVMITSHGSFLSATNVSFWLATDVGGTGYEGSSHGSLLTRAWAGPDGIYINNTYIINETLLRYSLLSQV